MNDLIVNSTNRGSRTNLAAAARRMVRSIFFLLPLVFTWLKLRNLSPSDIAELISDVSARDIVWKAALIIYFFAWVWGTLWDVGLQERVYLEAPNKGKMPWRAIGMAAAICTAGAVLVWVDSFVRFVGALALFTTVDHVAWRYLVNFLQPMIQQAREEYGKLDDAIALEQLRLVEDQVCGTWKWWRGLVGGVWIFVMLALAIEMSPESSIRAGRMELPWGFVQAASILVWVLLMEIWHWHVRIVTRVGVDTLEHLRDKYKLTPLLPRA
ncbi:hypothetical protein [Bradyrhizobium pachyrhizi]|uniref:hypothetical protein n=1 Tax=Bradyrhizobium pachyrhizi TaxID=280333 RepID=UPI00128EFD6E|nr:hypothetical protein [Bradyrhizobium pachyrhizi]